MIFKTLAILLFTLLKKSWNTWWSDYCCQNKGECDLNQSNVDSFVKRVARNNSENNDDRHIIRKTFLIVLFSS